MVADFRIGNLALAIVQERQAETGCQATEGDNDSTQDATPMTTVFGVRCFWDGLTRPQRMIKAKRVLGRCSVSLGLQGVLSIATTVIDSGRLIFWAWT